MIETRKLFKRINFKIFHNNISILIHFIFPIRLWKFYLKTERKNKTFELYQRHIQKKSVQYISIIDVE